MKALLLAVGFAFLGAGLYFELWPVYEPSDDHWVCYEPREDANEPPRHAANAIYGCTDTHWEDFASGLGLSTRSITGGGNEGVADGKTFAIVGVGFMVAALAAGRNVARGDDRPAIPGTGPAPVVPPSAGVPPSGQFAPPPPPGPGRVGPHP